MKFSVSSYSFVQYTREGKMTLIDCVIKAKEMGFDAIEYIDLPGTLDEQKALAAQINAKAKEVGIDVCAYTIGSHLYYDTAEEREAEVERLKGQVDVAKILGAKLMRHDVCYKLEKKGPGRSFDLMLPYLAESARKVTEYAETLGIRTCSENHGGVAQDSDRMERLFCAVNHDNYGLLVDIGNFTCADENHITAVSRVAPYAIHVHAKDMKIVNEYTKDYWITRGCNYMIGTVIGEGSIPVKQCFNILKNAGYDGYITVEFEGKCDCIDGIARGFANIKNYCEELGW